MSFNITHRMAIRRPSLIVNCGYARVCIYVNSDPNQYGRYSRLNIDIANRSDKFRSQFSPLSTYGIPEDYFTPTSNDYCSQFDRDCTKILDGFKLKFRGETGLNRESYLHKFSEVKWSELAQSEKEQHTLSTCTRCFEVHEAHQCSFPLKPIYHPEPVLKVDQAALQCQGVRAFTTNVVSELERVYSIEGSSFTNALLQERSLQLERKKTSSEKRKEKREIQRVITKKVRVQPLPC